MTAFTPRGARILVRKTFEPELRESGLILPEQVRTRPQHGVVMAIGPGEIDYRTGELRPVEGVQVGDEVLVHKYAGLEFKLGDEEVIVLKETDVVGVFK